MCYIITIIGGRYRGYTKCVKPLPSLIGGYRGYTQCVTPLPS